MTISNKDFLMMQPGYPEVAESDRFYFGVANELAKSIDDTKFIVKYGENITKEVILGVIGYFQDVVADAGLFRSFCTVHQELYGKWLPLFDLPEDYIESELNKIDIQFMVWYITECSLEENGSVSPFDEAIGEITTIIFELLDSYYEMAPMPDDYCIAADIDLEETEEIKPIYDLSYWLFWNSYFMRHAATPTMRKALEEGQKIISKHKNPEEARPLLLELNQNTMKENPTGPLALYIPEWLKAIVDNDSPFSKRKKKELPAHKYYTSFMAATGGEPIKILASYDELDNFLTNDMNWGKPADGGHLPQVREMNNFVLYATHDKGMLIAPDVAQYIALPGNTLYNKEEAEEDACSLITVQGRCPIDLTKYLFSNNLIPDARFSWDTTHKLLLDNWDFFARLFLQSFYRAR